MDLYNVLDKLKAIAETNDSEDVAAAIEQVDAYSFKARLKEAESASIYDQDDIDDFMGGPDETTVGKKVDETPGADDQYCATCGNTGEDLSQAGVACPNGCGGEAEGGTDEAWGRIHDRVEDRNGSSMDDLGDDPWGLGEDGVEDVEDTSGALDRVQDRSQRSGDGGPVDRVQDRVEARGGADDLGEDPWALGDYRDEEDDRYDQDGNWVDDNESEEEVEEAVNPVDVKDALKHLYQLLQSGLDPETKEAVQNAYIELKNKSAGEGA